MFEKYKLYFIFCGLFYSGFLTASLPVDAAEYYFSRQDFKQSLELYSSSNEPKNTFRIADLKFLLNGRVAARETIVTALEKNKDLSVDLKNQLHEKLTSVLEAFVTDEGQSEYFRAMTKIRHGDWATAESLLESASSREEGNTLVLELKSQCERELKKIREYTNTLQQWREQNPYSVSATEKLAESYFFDGDYSKVLTLFATLRPQKNSYGNLILLLSKAELGKYFDLDELEDYGGTYPIALFYVGKELAKSEEDRTEALTILSQFNQKSVNQLKEDWDPLKISEKVIESKKILAMYTKSLK